MAAGVALSPETTFALLGNDRRRAAIAVLASEGKADSVEALAREVAAKQLEVPAAHVTERQRKCVYVSLLQIHLPKLAEEGLIEWGGNGKEITAREAIGALAEVLRVLEAACEDGEGGG